MSLDKQYFTKKLAKLIAEIDCYTEEEMARALLRLSSTADSSVQLEPEFSKEIKKAFWWSAEFTSVVHDNNINSAWHDYIKIGNDK